MWQAGRDSGSLSGLSVGSKGSYLGGNYIVKFVQYGKVAKVSTYLWALGESLVPLKVLKALWAPFRR